MIGGGGPRQPRPDSETPGSGHVGTEMLKFVTLEQKHPEKRAPALRRRDWGEVYDDLRPEAAADQAARCSQCGVPFCQIHCPVSNNIPDWLMLTAEGPKLLEVNARFGDPECQVLVPRLRSDLLAALLAAHDGELKDFDLRWRDEAALCVVLATSGYPGAYRKGSAIRGIDAAEALGDVTVFHAGTARGDDGIVAAGGRVLGVTALGASDAAARPLAYDAVDRIDWPEGFCRRDIGWRAA